MAKILDQSAARPSEEDEQAIRARLHELLRSQKTLQLLAPNNTPIPLPSSVIQALQEVLVALEQALMCK